MVAIIKTSCSLRNVLHYNENKLKQEAAELIHSMNFGKDTELLGFTNKIKTLQKLSALNHRTQPIAVHISLNFDPDEKLSNEKLQQLPITPCKKLALMDSLTTSINIPMPGIHISIW